MPSRPTGRHHADWSPRRERGHRQWMDRSALDTDPERYGRRYATRDVTTDVSWGGHMARILREYAVEDYYNGRGLRRLPDKAGRCTLYVQGKIVGRTDDRMLALGWVRALNHRMGKDYGRMTL